MRRSTMGPAARVRVSNLFKVRMRSYQYRGHVETFSLLSFDSLFPLRCPRYTTGRCIGSRLPFHPPYGFFLHFSPVRQPSSELVRNIFPRWAPIILDCRRAITFFKPVPREVINPVRSPLNI